MDSRKGFFPKYLKYFFQKGYFAQQGYTSSPPCCQKKVLGKTYLGPVQPSRFTSNQTEDGFASRLIVLFSWLGLKRFLSEYLFFVTAWYIYPFGNVLLSTQEQAFGSSVNVRLHLLPSLPSYFECRDTPTPSLAVCLHIDITLAP